MRKKYWVELGDGAVVEPRTATRVFEMVKGKAPTPLPRVKLHFDPQPAGGGGGDERAGGGGGGMLGWLFGY